MMVRSCFSMGWKETGLGNHQFEANSSAAIQTLKSKGRPPFFFSDNVGSNSAECYKMPTV